MVPQKEFATWRAVDVTSVTGVTEVTTTLGVPRSQTTLMTTVLPLGALLPPAGSVLTTYCTPM